MPARLYASSMPLILGFRHATGAWAYERLSARMPSRRQGLSGAASMQLRCCSPLRQPLLADLSDSAMQEPPTTGEISIPKPQDIPRRHDDAPAGSALQHLEFAVVRCVAAAAQLGPDLSVNFLRVHVGG